MEITPFFANNHIAGATITGCHFESLQDIYPHFEPTGSGITGLWARTIALKHGCTVVVGYPEKVDISHKWPASPEYYNSAIVINEEGETVGGYRKSHLYGGDETWALEGGDGFFSGDIANMDATIGISTDITYEPLFFIHLALFPVYAKDTWITRF